MKNRLVSSYHLSSSFLFIAFLIVVASVLFTNYLVGQLEEEEKQRVELWAQATEYLIQADEGTDLNLCLSIIENNRNIPVYMLNAQDSIVDSRNVRKMAADPKALNGPIVMDLKDGQNAIQYRLYYDESHLLRQLKWFPYIEFGIILLFVLIAVISLRIAQKSEQNRVWVGLSKETAHQLGTPISSLMAWQQLLSERYKDDELIPEMLQDIQRLHIIADRFSKIGAEPDTIKTNILDAIEDTIAYMRTRISNKVAIHYTQADHPLMANVNKPLFSWVLENMIKNAVDAMDGIGDIDIRITEESTHLDIDIKDSGKGIERKLQKKIFYTGFTTKQRGHGLGLPLSKRIIEDYHGGELSILSSQAGQGTTFRIRLPKAENC